MSRATTRKVDSGAPLKRVAIYTRKSTAAGLEQDFNSLDAQREACEAYVRGKPGLALVSEHYDDGGFTGANLERPAFQRLMADIEARKIDLVVVYKVDRLSRSLLDFARVMERFDAADCAFVSVTQNFTTADAMGRLTLNLLMSFAEFEREMIADRTRDKIAAARKRGLWTGGRAPIGYRLGEGKLVVEPLEAIVVREIVETYLARRSLVAVLDVLRSRGRATKRHQSASGRVLAARDWTKDAVLRVLRNPCYAGLVAAAGELVPGQHAAIITREQFDAVQAVLGARSSGARPSSSERYLLAGLVRCGACGRGMTQASTTTRGKEYRYHRCLTRDRQGASACPTAPVAAEVLEKVVIEQIRRAAGEPALARAVVERAESLAAERGTALRAERDALPGAIAKLKADAKRIADAFVEASGVVRAELGGRLEDVAQRARAHELRLQAIDTEMGGLEQRTLDAEWVARTLRDFPILWCAMSRANRARLVHALVERVVVDQRAGKLAVHLRESVGAESEAA